jgi:hypothetical protein
MNKLGRSRFAWMVVFFFSLQSLAFCLNSPNILFILVDDLAWSDLGSYGHPWHETPRIDSLAKDGMWLDAAGSDAMMMAEMSSPPRVFTMVPYGQSDDPKSPYFSNQTERYTNGQYKTAHFTRETILAHASSRLSISTDNKQ